jgi:AraC family transcriptional regulator, transcriptional activator of pobA
MKVINSISEKHRLLSLPDPLHPLVSVVRIADIQVVDDSIWNHFALDFYCISLKRNVGSKMQYGQQYYDYDKGVMTFVAPKQVLLLDKPPVYDTSESAGYALFFHPDFLYNHPLAAKIKTYGFFSYAVNEALHLSEKEEKNIEDIFIKIDEEYQHIDRHTQDVIIAQIELLLNYSNRFYERQFITRRAANHAVLTRMEQLINDYFEKQESLNAGILTVEYLAKQLNLSPHYFSDLVKSLTEQSAQQHIQDKLIEKTKEYLTVTQLSVSEIAYQLGFQYPQSLNKLFKRKTSLSPLEFRKSFH